MQRYLDSLGLDRRLSAFLLAHRETLRAEGSEAMLQLIRERLPEFYDAAMAENHRQQGQKLRELLAPLADEQARAILRDFLSLTGVDAAAESAPDEDDLERLLAKLRRADAAPRLKDALAFIEELAQLNGAPAAVLPEARRLLRHYQQDGAALNEIERLLALMNELEVPAGAGWQIDLGLSRGLHYYSGAIFEVFHGEADNGAGAQRLGGGGRYDGLMELFGGPAMAACGFSFALERLALALAREGSARALLLPHTLLATADEWWEALAWAEKLRAAGCQIAMAPAGGVIDSARAIRWQPGDPPAFRWLADGEGGRALSWEQALARLKKEGGSRDD